MAPVRAVSSSGQRHGNSSLKLHKKFCSLCSLPARLRLQSSLTYLVTGTSGKAHPGLDLDSLPLSHPSSLFLSHKRARREIEREKEKWRENERRIAAVSSYSLLD